MTVFIRFFFTGASGALLSIATTWALTTFLVGKENYFSAYIVGIAVNIAFNFTIYTIAVFRTTRNHIERLLLYTLYSFSMAYLQSGVVRAIVDIVGTQWYLIVIGATIGAFAVFNFIVFKQSLFKELEEGTCVSRTQILIFLALCTGFVAVSSLLHWLVSVNLL